MKKLWDSTATRIVIAVTTLALGLLAMNRCSDASTVAERTLQEQIKSQSKGWVVLTSFQKTDGQKFEMNGIPGYTVSYEAEILFNNSGTWIMGPPGLGPIEFEFNMNPPPVGGIAGFMSSANGEQRVIVGQRVKIAGKLTGSKSENGWTFTPTDCHVESGL